MSLKSRIERAERIGADACWVLGADRATLNSAHVQTLALLRAVWKSRRKWQAVAADLAKQLGDVRALLSAAERYIDELEELHRPSGVLALRKRLAELEEDYAHLRNAQLDGGAR